LSTLWSAAGLRTDDRHCRNTERTCPIPHSPPPERRTTPRATVGDTGKLPSIHLLVTR